VSREVWFARRGEALIPADPDSGKLIERMGEDECRAFRPVGVRDPQSHRRYWAMMTETARNVKRIEIDRVDGQPVYMRLFGDKSRAHAAMKLCTGLYDTLPVGGSDYEIRVPRSTNFEEMTPEEWIAYWPKVLDVLLEKVAPEIEVPEARDGMLISIERWQREAA
jgi:hypothetical protein